MKKSTARKSTKQSKSVSNRNSSTCNLRNKKTKKSSLRGTGKKNGSKVSKSKRSSSSDDDEDEEEHLGLDVICQKCGAFTNVKCTNVDTGKQRHSSHNVRVEMSEKLAKNPIKMAAVEMPKPKKNPREKLTPEQKNVVDTILEKITALGKQADFVGPVSVGPVISTYRFFPHRRTKVAHLEAMAKDFAVALGAEAILVKRMPGESAVGVFVPNEKREMIDFKDTIKNVTAFYEKNLTPKHTPIPLDFGMTSDGAPFVEDLAKLPHLLIAGATGGGKSTLEHAIVGAATFVMPHTKLRLIISDTKGVEFRQFAQLPHLQFPIATSVYQTMEQLQWCIDETQRRLDRIGYKGVKNIHEYNTLVPEEEKLPLVMVVIDELADILSPALGSGEAKLNSAKLSTVVARSRASGIHVVAATQRPDVKMVAGAIKANFPARLTFRMSSQVDSRTVINTKGAEHLLTPGDMLYLSPLRPEMERLHAPYTSNTDVQAIIQYVMGRDAQPAQDGGAPVSTGATFRPN
jgi:S-DNA-T family DNA segregation ATPase FtsK/SpoIIIE